MNPMSYSNAFIEKVISFFRQTLNEQFFTKSELFFQKAASYAAPIAALLGLIIGLTAAIKTDSFTLFLAGIVWVLIIAVAYYIGFRFLNSCRILIANNPSRISSKDYLDILGLLNILFFIGVVLGGIFLSIKVSSLDVLKWAIVISIPLLFYISLVLNSRLISTHLASSVTAGEDALTILIIFAKVLVKTATIVFGTLIVVGAVLMVINLYDLLAGKSTYALYGGIDSVLKAATGSYLVLLGMIYPFFVYIYFILAYLFIDLCKSILSIPRAPVEIDESLQASDSTASLEQNAESLNMPDMNPATVKRILVAVGALIVLGGVVYGGMKIKANMDEKAAITKQEEENKNRYIAAKKDLIEQAKISINLSSTDFVNSPNAVIVFKNLLGDAYSGFASGFGQQAPLSQEGNLILGYGCRLNQCNKSEAAFVIDTQTGNIYAGIATMGVARYYGLAPDQPLPEAFNTWKRERNIVDSPNR